MPQRTVSTSTPLGYTISTMQAAINSLIANAVVGKDILASDLASYQTSVNNLWRVHTHTASDLSGIDTFGNLTVYGTLGTTVTATSGGPSAPANTSYSPIAGLVAGGQITAADINGLILIVNNMRVHNHTITDSVGATKPAVALSSQTMSDFQYETTSTASMTFQNDGTLVGSSFPGAIGGQWIDMHATDVATAAGYDIFVTRSSGPALSGSAQGTWLNLGTTRAWSASIPWSGASDFETTVCSVQIRNAITLSVLVSVTINLQTQNDFFPSFTCFAAGSNVLMPDGSWKLIEEVDVGDIVQGVDGPVPVIAMDRPLLGAHRKLLKFADESLVWSEEHAMWTRDATQSQWWWAYHRGRWLNEAKRGEIGGLTDNQSMRTGAAAAEWAHTSGWKQNTVVELTGASEATKLYLPRTDGSPIIVNGYVVGAGVNQAGFDYATLNWDTSRANLPVVQPLPTA